MAIEERGFQHRIKLLDKEHWPTDSMGKEIPLKSFVQFYTGTVSKVQTGEDAPEPITDLTKLGGIYALPHESSKGLFKESMSDQDGGFFYMPLLRGIQDVPVVGDQVLLCKFAGNRYYLGPLNISGTPSPDTDPFRSNQIASGAEKGSITDSKNSPGKFESSERARRLGKKRNFALDDPILNEAPIDIDKPWETPLDWEDPLPNMGTPISANLGGDLIIEGKYGNSIRLGNRNVHPNLIISNGRDVTNTQESTLDGSIFAMINRGTLHQHFNKDGKIVLKKGADGKTPIQNMGAVKYSFNFACDDTDKFYKGYNFHRSITKTMYTSLGRGLGKHRDRGGKETAVNDLNLGNTLWGYRGNQSFLNSGRLIFNARDESIFISANQFINLGAVNNINFSTSNTCLVEAASSMVVNTPLFKVNSPGKVVIDGRKNWKDNDRENIIGSIFLGDPTMPNADGELPKMGPAVVGDGLVTFLMELIHQCMQLCQDVSASIENRDDVGASLENFELRAKAFESILGIEMRKNSVGNDISHPKKLMDQILSNHVMLKK